MNAATEVMTATRMQHVQIPLDTLNAYVTQGLLEMGVYVQVIYIAFFFHNFLLKQSTSSIVQGKKSIFLSITCTQTDKIHRIKKLFPYNFFSMRRV